MKTFEQYNNEPQISQYVVCEEENINDDNEVKMFINNIGKIIEKDKDIYLIYPY